IFDLDDAAVGVLELFRLPCFVKEDRSLGAIGELIFLDFCCTVAASTGISNGSIRSFNAFAGTILGWFPLRGRRVCRFLRIYIPHWTMVRSIACFLYSFVHATFKGSPKFSIVVWVDKVLYYVICRVRISFPTAESFHRSHLSNNCSC